jgi:hypothetical protein
MTDLKAYADRLAALTDDELINERYASLAAHTKSAENERDIAFQKTLLTEAAMITRFGFDAHKVLAAKYPILPSF